MAKKKGVIVSPFVPVEEQPYPIPENWCWVYAPSIFNIEYGKGLPTKELTEKGYPVFGANGQIGFYHSFMFDNSKALMSCRGAYSGTMNLSLPKSFITNNSLIIDCKNSSISAKFIYYLFEGLDKESLVSGTAQPQVTVQAFAGYPVPFPPLLEQQRIVVRIESLFAKLDESKEKAQAVVDGFELRKSAILHKAFTGELTERWRKEHGVGLDRWKDTTLSEIVSGFKYGTSEKSTYNNTGMPVLRIPNVGTGTLSFEDMKYLAHNDMDEANQVHENDLLIIRSNGSRDLVGKCAIVPALSRKFAYASFLIRIIPSERILPNYLMMYLNSTDARTQMFKKAKSSAGINNINSQELGSITITVPTTFEQSEIISVLNSLLTKEQQAKEAAEAVLSQIDTMKKAILARAFRGDLGTNDPAEESAAELLKSTFCSQSEVL